jgi:hypothetical protein
MGKRAGLKPRLFFMFVLHWTPQKENRLAPNSKSPGAGIGNKAASKISNRLQYGFEAVGFFNPREL